MGKRKQIEEQPQLDEEKKQADEPQQPERDEEELKEEKKKRKKEKKEKKRRATDETEERKHEETTVEAAAEGDGELEEAGEKEKEKKVKKRDKKVKQEAADEMETEAETEQANSHIEPTVKSEQQSAADDEYFDLASLKRANKTTASSAATAAFSSSASSPSAPPVEASSRIFIGNLSFKITDELLHSAFSHCGAIDGVHWVTDKTTGKFYGSAFIDFQSPTAVPAALLLNNTELLGRPMKVGLATGRQSAGQNRFNQKQKNGGHLALHPISDKPDGTTTVFLGNLSFEIDEETVRQSFKDCGEVKQVRWVEKDGVFKGCGFVEFHDTEATDLAVKLNGREVLGRPMRVDYSGNTSRD